jgi:uncharacterized protein (DUF779 family)
MDTTRYTPRVLITEAAAHIVDKLRAQHGPLMFHQSGGCCDGSQPMCFPKGEFRTGASDVWIGTVHECSFFMNADQFAYWQHTQLTIDIVPGRGSSFSLEIPLGVRFIIQSRLYTPEEEINLQPIRYGDEEF